MNLLTKTLAGLAAVALAATGALAAGPSHASSVTNGWSRLQPEQGQLEFAGAMITSMDVLAAAGCRQGDTWTLVLRRLNDPDYDGYNNDVEPKGTPGGLVPLTPGNPVAHAWQRTTVPVQPGQVMRLDVHTMTNYSVTELGSYRALLGAVCVTDSGAPDHATQAVRLDNEGHPIAEWFPIEISPSDIYGVPSTYRWINVPAFAAMTPPTVTVAATRTREVTVDRWIPVTVPQTVWVMVDGIGTVTQTVRATVSISVPGPTVTLTQHPDPFGKVCHKVGGPIPWWCTLEGTYWSIVQGWIN